ncbi:MAG: trypsin-like serine protease, partial [Planctomycetota bacterium]|nr:trypsin-like serine protease [Planctomycetota bacterium]
HTHGQDKVEIRLRATNTEKAILFVAPNAGNPIRFPGIDGDLKLDPSTMFMVGAGKAIEPGTGQFNVTRPKGLHANLHGQALVMTPKGMRLSKPFRIFDEDPTVNNPKPGNRDPNKLPSIADDKDLGQASVAIMGSPGNVRFDVWLRPEGSGPAENTTKGHRAGKDADGPSESGQEMSGLSLKSAATSESFPYRVNCRLRMVFPGSSSTWGGSGVLIDPYHVMTAGHCVYDHDLGGYASSITVIPAYDDDRSDPSPFGTASWTGSKLIWTGWVTNKQGKHDIAVIRLDRPIGALTSWFGYGYNTSCSFYKGTTFYSGSYPIESHTGNDMYWRSGTFDYCPNSRETRFWRLGYGGESGSGYYYKKSGSRYVHGVLSHGTWTVWHGDVTDIVRLNESKFDSVKSYLEGYRPSSADIMPLYVRCDSSVGRGDSLSVTFRILNYGRSDKNGFSYKIYLSTNDYISTSDTLLTSVTTSSTVDDVSTKDFTKTVTIPSALTTGTWYIGVMTTSSDANSSNNTTQDQEVAQITVTR